MTAVLGESLFNAVVFAPGQRLFALWIGRPIIVGGVVVPLAELNFKVIDGRKGITCDAAGIVVIVGTQRVGPAGQRVKRSFVLFQHSRGFVCVL